MHEGAQLVVWLTSIHMFMHTRKEGCFVYWCFPPRYEGDGFRSVSCHGLDAEYYTDDAPPMPRP